MICELCDREILVGDESRHHLIPKATGGKNGEKAILHTICHKQIHALYNEKTLANHLNTVSKLKNDMHIKRFIKWIKTKPLNFNTKARMSSIRR